MRLWPWRKRRLPVRRYTKFYHSDGTCYIQTDVIWDGTGAYCMAKFRRYDDYRAEQRLA
jgi:hypothetical protein